MSKNTRNRILLTALAALLLVTLTIGGTMAWLVDTTGEVTNTFTTAGIDIDLTETKDADGNWSMKLIPGNTKFKNPTLTVNTEKTDIPIWLFVKVNENNASLYLEYDMILDSAEGWTPVMIPDLEEGSAVYVYEWDPGDPASWELLANNEVKVRENLVEAGDTISGGIQMPANGFNITFQAYAIQKANHNTAIEAWNAIEDEAY